VLVGNVPPSPPIENTPSTWCGTSGFGCHEHLRSGYFGKNTPIPGNHHYSINPSRPGSEQNVHLLPHSGTTEYTGYGNVFPATHASSITGAHTGPGMGGPGMGGPGMGGPGMGGPGMGMGMGTGSHSGNPGTYVGSGTKSGVGHTGSYANTMLGPQPKVTVPHAAGPGEAPGYHSFGSEYSSANAMYVPHNVSQSVAGSSQASFYGHSKTFEFHHPLVEKKVLPEQILEPGLKGSASNAAALGREAQFVTGKGFLHSHSLRVANAMERAHVSGKTQSNFITSTNFEYGPAPHTHQPYGVAYATQTQRLPNAKPSGLAGQEQSYGWYAAAVDGQQRTAAGGSAYSMSGKRPHISKANFCDLFPDRCFFAPAPETQGIAGMYHSI